MVKEKKKEVFTNKRDMKKSNKVGKTDKENKKNNKETDNKKINKVSSIKNNNKDGGNNKNKVKVKVKKVKVKNNNKNNNSIVDMIDNSDNSNNVKQVPLMRRATALWLIDNTSLTFQQIADFCDIHILEVEGMADGDVGSGITAQNPIDNGQLTREMISECENDKNKKLTLKKHIADDIVLKKSGRKNNSYVPLARRGDKPDAIMYLLKYYPNITDQQIRTLISTTTPMINSIRNRTFWNIKEVKPRDPVILGLCSQGKFNSVVEEVER